MIRYILFAVAIIIGAGLGYYYGTEISPLELVDTAPDTLRIDYRSDYILTVAEIYNSENDIAAAEQRLALLGNNPITEINNALLFGVENGYSVIDLNYMRQLSNDLVEWKPNLLNGDSE